MLEIQKFFQKFNYIPGGNISSEFLFSELEKAYAIKSSIHSKYSNLVLFKYNQIESPFSERIVRECRGIILDMNNNWEIVSFPFMKFFNYGEGHADQIDWNNAVIQEKLDGSLITLYSYDNMWHVATSGTPDAKGNVNGFDFSFADLFWKAFEECGASLPALDCGKCFMFELMSPYNKVVVRHDKLKIACLGGRDLKSNLEMSAKEASNYFTNINPVREFSFKNVDEILLSFPSLNPLGQEGYVVLSVNDDLTFNRIKLKSPAYVALHHLKDGLSSKKSLINVVLNGEIDEVCSSFPEYKSELIDFKQKIDELTLEMELEYKKIMHIPVQKDFALLAVKTKVPGALFAIRSGKAINVSEYFRNMNVDNFMNVLGI